MDVFFASPSPPLITAIPFPIPLEPDEMGTGDHEFPALHGQRLREL